MNQNIILPVLTPAEVRAALQARHEIALIDVREEDPFAQAHPLFAVQISAGRVELDAPWRLPRHDVPIVVYDNGEGLAVPVARTLIVHGYNRVHLLDGGLQGWRENGGELFRDVNVPSKAFGELVEHELHTPSLPAGQVKALIDRGADLAILDVRRFDEYQAMSIPGGISVPGAELVLQACELVLSNPTTQVIINCAGRTRSIIGTQSLVNAGISNPVAALHNGTMGWKLAGFELDHGQQRRFGPVSEIARAAACKVAQALADRSGAVRLDAASLAAWAADTTRTLYLWDVRTPEEYAAGHLPGFGSSPGGQLVQETDVFAAVRGARIVLADGGPAGDGVRAAMTAHWLAQMGWQVGWLTDADPEQFTDTGPWQPVQTPPPSVTLVSPAQLSKQLQQGGTLLLDVGTSAQHVKGHIPGACWVLRSQMGHALRQVLQQVTSADNIVVTSGTGALARFAAADLVCWRDKPVAVLEGGTTAWAAEGRPLATGEQACLSPRIDRYRRPYEGTDAPREAMQGYLNWEFGLVKQLARDGTHGFKILPAA
jgi:rhodanese-related sulfurtransferase